MPSLFSTTLYPWLARPVYCEHLWMRISIQADGAVEPCSCALSASEPIPFQAGGLHAIWNSEPFVRTRQSLLRRMKDPRAEAGEGVFDCCRLCPVAPNQRFQTPREYYTNLGRLLSIATPFRREKLDNLARLQREARAGLAQLSARPAWANIDPCNVCNLRCPECIVGRREYQRPKAMMTPEHFEAIMEELGPTLMFIEFYRYGEPMLNRDLPALIELAEKKYGVTCRVSSNFAMALTDEQLGGLVESGLSRLVIGADDVVQERYERYRRGGDAGVVLDNLRRLTAIRKSRGSRTPSVLWQALRFSFNEDHRREIKRVVKEAGADRFVMLPAYISGENEDLLPKEAMRRGQKDKRPRPIESASLRGEPLAPGEAFELEATVVNNLWADPIPAEDAQQAHPVRVGVKGADGDRVELTGLGDLGRLAITRPVAKGERLVCSGRLSLPESADQARLRYLKLDLLAEGAYWFEAHNDIQSEPYYLPVRVGPAAE